MGYEDLEEDSEDTYQEEEEEEEDPEEIMCRYLYLRNHTVGGYRSPGNSLDNFAKLSVHVT